MTAARAASTARRREDILDAALDLFTEQGVAATTMADVRARSGASIGSIYHHFGGKEQLAAALYVEGLAGYQREVAELLEREPDAERGLKAVVRHHLEWVAANPRLARYLLASRPAEVAEETREPLRELNRRLFRAVRAWLAPHLEAGRVKPLPIDLFHTVLLGPSQEYARLWLAGRANTPIDRATEELADAAWAALAGARKRG